MLLQPEFSLAATKLREAPLMADRGKQPMGMEGPTMRNLLYGSNLNSNFKQLDANPASGAAPSKDRIIGSIPS